MEEIIASTYRIIRKLGSGGGGNVYLADHLRLNKKVVLPEQPYITFSVAQSRRKTRRQSYRFQKKNIVRRL